MKEIYSGFVDGLKLMFWIVLIVGLAFVFRASNKLLIDADAAVIESHRRIVDSSENLNALLIQLGLTADVARRTAETQEEYWNATGKKTEAIATGIQDVVAGLKDQTVPAATGAFIDYGRAAQRAQDLLLTTSTSVAGFNRVLADLDDQVSNPEIGATVHGLNLAAAGAAETMTNASRTTKRVDNVAAKYEADLLKPTGFVKNLFWHVIVPGASLGAEIATAAK